jgi:myo-inositol-1(or 4)-monophosphatase
MTDGSKADGSIPERARELAVQTARDAGAVLRERLGSIRDVQFKGITDLVTDADRASEALIAERIKTAFPGHRFVGEEGTRGAEAGTAHGWIVDPLDGTTNYAHGYPHFAVSIGLEHAGRVVLGVVYDPMRDELFVAERGRGATLNGTRLRVTGEGELIRSLLATGFPYEPALRPEGLAIWNDLMHRCQGVRRDGAAALNLAYVAAGRLDGFYERPLQPWDMAAGTLLVEEAGGTVTGFDGGRFDPYAREAVATNGPLHAVLLDTLARHRADLTPASLGLPT